MTPHTRRLLTGLKRSRAKWNEEEIRELIREIKSADTEELMRFWLASSKRTTAGTSGALDPKLKQADDELAKLGRRVSAPKKTIVQRFADFLRGDDSLLPTTVKLPVASGPSLLRAASKQASADELLDAVRKFAVEIEREANRSYAL